MPFQFSDYYASSDQELLASFVPQLERFLGNLLFSPEQYFRGDYQPQQRVSDQILENLRILFRETLPNFRQSIETALLIPRPFLERAGLSGASLRAKFKILELTSIQFLSEASHWLLKKILGYANIILDSFGAAASAGLSATMGIPSPVESVKELKGFIEKTFLDS